MKQLATLAFAAVLHYAAPAQTFAPVTVVSCGRNSAPRSIAIADVNADGKPDVLTANFGTNSAGVLVGTGTGTFALAATPGTNANSNPQLVAVADINSDGRPDVLLDNSNGYAVSGLLGDGAGGFAFRYSYPLGVPAAPGALVVADANNDGRVDILTTNTNSAELGILLGDGAAGFTAASFPSTGTGTYPAGLAVADVNKDGKLDAVTANAGNGTVGILLGNGTGGFALRSAVALGTGSFPNAVAVRDVNGDSNPDIVVADYQLSKVSVLLGTGTGSFTLGSSAGCGGQPSGLVLADINQDGKLDALTANSNTSMVSVLLGNGQGSFALAGSFSCGANSQPAGLAVADVNGDSRPDILTANYYTNTVGVLLNTTPLAAQVSVLAQAQTTVAPNPAAGAVLITATNLPLSTGQLSMVLTDAAGRTTQHLTLPVAQGTARITLPLDGQSAGLFLLRLTCYDSQGALVGILPAQRLSIK